MKDSIQNGDHLYQLMDMTIEEARPDYARVSMPISLPIVNGMGVAHGGALFTLADIAFGAASNCEEETGTVTLSTSIQFLAPGRMGPFTAEARLVRGGRRIVTYDVDVRDADGTLLVHAVTQGMKTDRPFKVVK